MAFFNLICYNGIDIYSAEKAKAIESTCQVSVVADQERIAKNWCGNSALGEKDAEGSPFKRSSSWSIDRQEIESSNGRQWQAKCGVALHMVQSHEWEACQPLPSMWRTLARYRGRLWNFLQCLAPGAAVRPRYVPAVAQVSETQVTLDMGQRKTERSREKSQTKETKDAARGGDCTASTTARCSSGSYGCSWTLMDAGGTEHTSACTADFSRSPSGSCPDTTGVQVVDRHTSEESIQRHFA